MKQIVLSFLIICSTTIAFGQITLNVPENTKTLLVTKRGEKLWGKAEVDQKSSIVKMISGNKFRFILFENIHQLKVFDKDKNQVQAFQYYELPNRPGKGKLLEQVTIGDVDLLRTTRVRYHYRVAKNGTEVLTPVIYDSEHFLWANNSLRRVKKFKKQVLSLCSDDEQKEKLKKFVKEENLFFSSPWHRASIVSHLNELKQ